MKAMLVCAYGAIAALVLGLAWLPLEVTVSRYLYEDFFYYLNIARHFVEDGSVTFDGSAPTNGFHPLWMLVSIACQALGGSSVGPHLALTVAALLHLGQVGLLYQIARQLVAPGVAHFAAILFGANYRVIACNMCGLETPLVGLAVLGIVYFCLRSPLPLTPRSAARLGFVLGLAGWCRMDLLLPLVLLGGAVLVLPWLTTTLASRVRVAAALGGTAALTLSPWFVWSYLQSATLLPNSRRALEILAVERFDLGAGIGPNVELLTRKAFGAAWWLADTANWLGLSPFVLPSYRNLGGIIIAALMALVSWGLFVRLPGNGSARLVGLWLYALAHFAYYALFSGITARYLIPFSMIAYLCAVYLVGERLARLASSDPRVLAVAAVLMANVGISSVAAWNQSQGAARTHRDHGEFLQAARWMNENAPPGAVVGGWNSGIMGYYSGHQVVNLDGLVNDEAMVALEKRALGAYITRRDIEYLVDRSEQMESFMRRFSGVSDWTQRFPIATKIGAIEIRKRALD